MRKSTIAKLQASARRGARFLDKNLPGWDRTVKITKLRMELGSQDTNGCGCVLAQTHEDYLAGLRFLELETADARALGFTLIDDCFTNPAEGSYEYWPALDNAWKDEIRKRRAAA